jgi:hypothetical protein
MKNTTARMRRRKKRSKKKMMQTTGAKSRMRWSMLNHQARLQSIVSVLAAIGRGAPKLALEEIADRVQLARRLVITSRFLTGINYEEVSDL